MDAANGNWEVVRKNQKKGKQNAASATASSNKLTKSQVKEFLDKMPRLDEMQPLKESRTVFGAFLEKQQTNNKSSSSQGSNKQSNKTANAKNTAVSANKENAGKRKKGQNAGTEKKKEEKPVASLEEALAKVNISELRSLMEMVKVRFPASPNIWLKDLVSYLNIKLNVETAADPNAIKDDCSQPLSLVSRELCEIIDETLNTCTPSILQLFFERSVTEMVDDIIKGGMKTHGYRILLQAIVRMIPHIVTQNLTKYCNMRNSYQNRPQACLAILWTVGQSGVVDFEIGLKVWLEIMLPVLCMRAYSRYTVDYLSALLRWHSVNDSSKAEAIRVVDFYPVFDTVYNNSATFAPSIHKDLLAIYPKIKSLAFGPNPSTNLRNFFPSFLTRLQPTCSQPLKTELLSCLVYCLKTDTHCYSIWRQLYMRHLVQSSILLRCLLNQWDRIGQTLPQPLLKETFGAFSVTNEELATQKSKIMQEGLADCRHLCKELLSKMTSKSMFPWKSILFFTLTVLSGVILYDCQLHGSLKASKTGRILQDLGLLDVCEHAWIRTKTYSFLCYQWAEKNVPHYYAIAYKFCEPYIKLTVAWFGNLGNSIVDFVFYVNRLLITNIPLALQWLDEKFPGALAAISSYLNEFMTAVTKIASQLWRDIAYCLQVTGSWLSENVFTGPLAVEKIQAHAYQVMGLVRGYTSEAFQWIGQQIQSK